MLLRYCSAVILLLLPALVSVAQDASDGFRYIAPSTFDRKAELMISGKRREYCVLEEGQKVAVTVKGPSRLKVLSRAVLNNSTDTTSYTFLAIRKGSRKTISFTHQTYASAKAAFAGESGGVISVSRSRIIDVPRGSHTYTFYLPKGSPHRLLLRFAHSTNAFTNGTSVSAMTPLEFTTPVDLVSSEEVSTYYRVGTEHRAVLSIIGPATLKVLARVEYDMDMTGTQKWKIRVTEDGRVKNTYSLAASRSTVTGYREPSAFVPSRAEVFYVEVPAGEHRYEFSMPENHRTTLLRFLLPDGQLERE